MHYGFITINGSRFTGPRCDKYLTKIIYSPIKHKHLAFNNLNTCVKLSNSLSDTHFFFRPTSFISIHGLFPIYMCVLCKQWWKPVVDINSLFLITFAKIIAHVHTLILYIHMALGTCQATFNCAILPIRLLLSFLLLRVIIEYYFILLITQLLIMNLHIPVVLLTPY